MDSALLELIRQDLAAMRRSGEEDAVRALRILLSAIENATAVETSRYADATEVPRRTLTADDLRHVLGKERSEMLEAARQYDQAGQSDMRDRLRVQAAWVDRYEAMLGED